MISNETDAPMPTSSIDIDVEAAPATTMDVDAGSSSSKYMDSDSAPQEAPSVSAEVEVKARSDDDEFGVDLGERKASMFGTIVNASNTAVGAGILALAYAFGEVGYAGGVILLLAAALCSWFGLHLTSEVCMRLGGDQLSFGAVGRKVTWWFPLVADVLVWIICFAVAALYLSTSANFMVPAAQFIAGPDADPDAWYLSRTFYVVLPFVLFGVPLTIPRKVTVLAYTSTIAMFAILYTACLVVAYAAKPVEFVCSEFLEQHGLTECVGDQCCASAAEDAECCIGDVVPFVPSVTKFFEAAPVMFTSFCMAPQFFQLMNALRRPSLKRADTASGVSVSFVTVLYLIVAVSGYVTYGSQVSEDLLGSYPLNTEVTVARIGLAFLTAVSYPLLAQPARDSMVHMIGLATEWTAGSNATAPGHKAARPIYFAVVVFTLASTFGLAMLNVNMATLLNIGGALSVGNLSFTLPAVYYWIIFREDGLTFKRVMCIPLALVGIIIMIVNIVLWVA